jgi:hypothetical protein
VQIIDHTGIYINILMSYQLINLPILPDELIASCIQASKEPPFYNVFVDNKKDFCDTIGYDVPGEWPNDGFNFPSPEDAYEYIWSTPETPVKFSLLTAPKDVIKWVEENAIPFLTETMGDGYTFIEPNLCKLSDGTILLPHIDPVDYVFNFVVEAGGDNVITKIYDIKEEHIGKMLIVAAPYDYTKIELAGESLLKEHTWGMLVGKRIHSVNNLTGSRLLLQIGVNKK